ncbi:hyoscyamine 6-dioxygenase-like [Chenopodium quinoa]|uniref:Fe2OG dioxygenase domain-containing protein n=1 Tax=Chenopodium quinoa TaxID=63459 RepID=A0A803M7R1_CHEQI|nr:hyoscyamine 6-dioxygenase-like [Chenopodium quinoa]
MANLLSTSVIIANREIPQKYVLPPDKRTGHVGKIEIPIIDLNDEKNSIQHIMKASQDLGLFQVINHGISNELMNDAMNVFKEVFDLPPEERSKINMKEDLKNICRIYSSSYNYDTEEFHFWRDILRHICSPLEECIKFWPQNPKNYREIVGAYVVALKGMGMKILENISQGLGLEKNYFANELTEDNILTINHYPICPDPSLTIGLPKHKDPTLINIVQAPADVPGLQLFKDGQWFSFETAPNAFLVFVGNQLEVVSNGKMKGVVHRVVTNSNNARTTAVFFVSPSMECIVKPAKALSEAGDCGPLYKAFRYKDYFNIHTGHDGDRDAILETYNFKI